MIKTDMLLDLQIHPFDDVFTPASLPGITLWLDASKISGLSDGDEVVSWLDTSGKGYSAIQATATKKPLYKTAQVNGLPCVRFDGSNDGLYVESISINTYISVFVVALYNSGGNLLLEQSADANSNNGFYLTRHNTQTMLVRRTSSTYIQSEANWITASWTLGEGHYNNYARYLCYKNGYHMNINGYSGSSTNLADSAVSSNLNIFCRNQASSYMNGDLAEVIICDLLSPYYQYLTRKYLNDKYNLGIDL